jgi:hypothetical protein
MCCLVPSAVDYANCAGCDRHTKDCMTLEKLNHAPCKWYVWDVETKGACECSLAYDYRGIDSLIRARAMCAVSLKFPPTEQLCEVLRQELSAFFTVVR